VNLEKLFEAQKNLDEHITRKKGLEGQDLFAKKILALLVELGELANEWRGFKFWSQDQQPRTKVQVYTGSGRKIEGKYKNPLLEEYVDCLHFILSIGLELGFSEFEIRTIPQRKDVTSQFLKLMRVSQDVLFKREVEQEIYKILISEFIALGKMLGFTWEQIEEAYFAKNAVNHERQESGY